MDRLTTVCSVDSRSTVAAEGVVGHRWVSGPILGDAPWLSGDPLRLRQILVTLVGNAIKITESGTVTITVAGRVEGAVRFSVADTGIGIDPSALDRVLDPFSQADDSTTRRFGGSGFGLAICAQLVDLMGGTPRIDSGPRGGSRAHTDHRGHRVGHGRRPRRVPGQRHGRLRPQAARPRGCGRCAVAVPSRAHGPCATRPAVPKKQPKEAPVKAGRRRRVSVAPGESHGPAS